MSSQLNTTEDYLKLLTKAKTEALPVLEELYSHFSDYDKAMLHLDSHLREINEYVTNQIKKTESRVSKQSLKESDSRNSPSFLETLEEQSKIVREDGGKRRPAQIQ